MKILLRLVLAAALVALGLWLWSALFPSPEKIIRKRLAELARDVSFSAGEGNLARLAGAEQVAGFFSTNVEVRLDVPGRVRHRFVGREQITQAALASRSETSELIVKFPDVNVSVAPDKQSATVDLTVEADVSGRRNAIVQEMKFTFQKIQGRWLITRVETVRTLSQDISRPAPRLEAGNLAIRAVATGLSVCIFAATPVVSNG
ncbi:MAG: hypothetical protein KGJ60_12730 [Verrucomicrobiota bacterium]|nr:hypothetical protein [Verrucomicrobiota bacterium]